MLEIVEYAPDIRTPDKRVVIATILSGVNGIELQECDLNEVLPNASPLTKRHVELVLRSLRLKIKERRELTAPSPQVLIWPLLP